MTEESSISAWSLDSSSIFTASLTQLKKRDSTSGLVHGDTDISSLNGTPYKVIYTCVPCHIISFDLDTCYYVIYDIGTKRKRRFIYALSI